MPDDNLDMEPCPDCAQYPCECDEQLRDAKIQEGEWQETGFGDQPIDANQLPLR